MYCAPQHVYPNMPVFIFPSHPHLIRWDQGVAGLLSASRDGAADSTPFVFDTFFVERTRHIFLFLLTLELGAAVNLLALWCGPHRACCLRCQLGVSQRRLRHFGLTSLGRKASECHAHAGKLPAICSFTVAVSRRPVRPRQWTTVSSLACFGGF